MENVRRCEQGGEYLTYQMNTLLKAWSYLAGAARPVRPPVLKKSVALKRMRPPVKLAGAHMYCVCFVIFCIQLLMDMSTFSSPF